MTMYDKYFPKEEQKRFPLLNTVDNSTDSEWVKLVKSVREAMQMRVSQQSLGTQALAKRWMSMLVRDTHGDPRLLRYVIQASLT